MIFITFQSFTKIKRNHMINFCCLNNFIIHILEYKDKENDVYEDGNIVILMLNDQISKICSIIYFS